MMYWSHAKVCECACGWMGEEIGRERSSRFGTGGREVNLTARGPCLSLPVRFRSVTTGNICFSWLGLQKSGSVGSFARQKGRTGASVALGGHKVSKQSVRGDVLFVLLVGGCKKEAAKKKKNGTRNCQPSNLSCRLLGYGVVFFGWNFVMVLFLSQLTVLRYERDKQKFLLNFWIIALFRALLEF